MLIFIYIHGYVLWVCAMCMWVRVEARRGVGTLNPIPQLKFQVVSGVW